MHNTPFGNAFIATTLRGICNSEFLEGAELDEQVTRLQESWRNAILCENQEHTFSVIDTMFGKGQKLDRPVSLHVSGTNFQISVWKALLQIPQANVVSYSQVSYMGVGTG